MKRGSGDTVFGNPVRRHVIRKTMELFLVRTEVGREQKLECVRKTGSSDWRNRFAKRDKMYSAERD